jgi:hypothetical protein
MVLARGSAHELTNITRTYDLVLGSCHHTGRFPRNHGFVLGERIERKLYDLPQTQEASHPAHLQLLSRPIG